MIRIFGIRAAVMLLTPLLAIPCLPQSATAPPENKPNPVDQYKPQGYVSDFAGMLDARVKTHLEAICKDLDEKKKTQMAIVTVDSVEGVPIRTFAMDLANHWGVGYKDTNRGIVVLLSRKEHQWRIDVGFGLESVLTDEEAGKLGREMVPMLQKEEYGNALLHVAKRIHEEILDKVR
jgi:uncharacterized protein